MTNEEYNRRCKIINKAITALQKRANVKVYTKEIKVDSLDDDKLNVNFIYMDSRNWPDEEPDMEMSIV